MNSKSTATGSGGLKPPARPRLSDRTESNASHRSTSSLSNISDESVNSVLEVNKRPPQPPTSTRPSTAGSNAPTQGNNTGAQNFSRPGPRGGSIDSGSVRGHPSGMAQASIGHRPRQHSQGFFEPSLPHASPINNSAMSASQIAAAAAMSHLGAPSYAQHERKRSVPGLAPLNTTGQTTRRAPSPAMQSPPPGATGHMPPPTNTVGNRLAATSAANAAYPRSPISSPVPPHGDNGAPPPPPPLPPQPEKDARIRERSKMKLFSKPKTIGTSKDKDVKPPMPSPGKSVFRPSIASLTSASTTSLVDPGASSASSIYSAANASTSTLVPITTTNLTAADKEKEKHRPYFLSRQKHKTGDRNLPLSSASSNSQAVDPTAPQSLYSFAPQSPGAQSSFSKTMSGLDLRHGGRALREKKKEEKAAAASLGLTQVMSNSSINLAVNTSTDHRHEFLGPGSLGSESFFGPSSGTPYLFANDQSAAAFSNLGNVMGLTGITADDAWPLLKARLLNIFEGEDLRTPIEDFNLLVSVHIRRCVQNRAPVILVEDVRDLLHTGFSSLAQTLRNLPEDRLVPNLVEMWHMVWCTILPFIQAVFLPLDLEFRSHGSIMNPREAAEFWGAMPDQSSSDERPASAGGTLKLPSLPEELDVRRMTLITFRDTVILPRHDQLLATFSRLSLEIINAGPSESMAATARSRGASNSAIPGAERPGTANSLSPGYSSFNSQTSTLLDAASTSSSGLGGGSKDASNSRSRATSNTSAGSFGTSLPHLPSPGQSGFPPSAHARSKSNISLSDAPLTDPAQITETVARMLQCVSVLASVQTGDQGQAVVERLTGALKWNWLGRGRTGRQRKGFVGMRTPVAQAGVVGA